jgi:hypothetical protein
MSLNHPSPIFYFLIANNISKKKIGEYIDEYEDEKNYEYLNKIKSTSNDILFSEEKNKQKTNKINFPEHNIYYILTNSNTLYYAAVKKDSQYSIPENLIFELIQDIDNQGIKKLLDKNGELTNVGKQNLKFSIENYQTPKKKKFSNFFSSFFESKTPNDNNDNIEDDNKIRLVTAEVDNIQNNMIENVKNMIRNVSEIKGIENKSETLKDTSFQFQKNASELERSLRWQNIRNKIILILILLFILFIVYKIFF